ncbi:unnamed protein product [Ambrosiozyma monospora]|uniref:Unnamed protein product n=1 Tax=Ambrosiozyma monospora TaxID=43982 RepID=A0A9W6Z5Y8_AMBMO|nr:unnamed protein product [Ambrosiozyma monospora]
MPANTNNKRKLLPLLPNTLLPKRLKLSPDCSPSPSSSTSTSTSSSPSPPSGSALKLKNPTHLDHHHHHHHAHPHPHPHHTKPILPKTADIQQKQQKLKQSLPLVTTKVINKNPPNFLDQPKPRHLKSCSRCRKHKTKCNYVDTQPNPCTACAKRGLTCELEIVIPVKRSNIIKNLADNVHELQQLVDQLIVKDKFLKTLCIQKGLKIDGLIDFETDLNPTCSDDNSNNNNNNSNTNDTTLSSSSSSTSRKPVSSVEMVSSISSTTQSSYYSSISSCCSTNSSASCSADADNEDNCDTSDCEEDSDESPMNSPSSDIDLPCTLFQFDDELSLTQLEASQYLNTFNLNYLPMIPILPIFKNPLDLYSHSKLLFWTIVYVVSRQKYPLIYSKFIKRKLLYRSFLLPPNKISIVQCILLLAWFPIKGQNKTAGISSHHQQQQQQQQLQSSIVDEHSNSTMMLWLQLAKDICLQIGLNRSIELCNGEFSRRVQDDQFNGLITDSLRIGSG